MGLMQATTAVLGVIDWRKQNLIAHFWFTGTLGALTEYIQTAPHQAVESARKKGREDGA